MHKHNYRGNCETSKKYQKISSSRTRKQNKNEMCQVNGNLALDLFIVILVTIMDFWVVVSKWFKISRFYALALNYEATGISFWCAISIKITNLFCFGFWSLNFDSKKFPFYPIFGIFTYIFCSIWRSFVSTVHALYKNCYLARIIYSIVFQLFKFISAISIQKPKFCRELKNENRYNRLGFLKVYAI